MAYYRRAEATGWYSHGGPCNAALGDRLGPLAGGGGVGVPVANGTLGLMLALRAVGVDPGGNRRPGRVAMASFNCPAVACAVLWAGFEPLWVDVDPDGWQLDPLSLERGLSERPGEVVAVIGTTTFGTAPEASCARAWCDACERAGVPLIVDAASALGAVADGMPVGTYGAVTLFSFGATKPSGVGEGAVLVTTEVALADKVRSLANFGMSAGTTLVDAPGLNARVSELHAAAMLAALDRLDERLAARREVAASLLARLPARVVGQRGARGSTRPALHVLVSDGPARDRVVGEASRLGVETRTLWAPALHRQPAFAGHASAGDLAVTEMLEACSLSLPLLEDMTSGEVDLVGRACLAAGRWRERP